jgi:flagellar protein FliL
MTDVTEGELAEGDADAGKKKGRRRLVIIGAIVLALLVAGGAGAWFLLGAGGGSEQRGVQDTAEPHFYNLPLMTVNLNNGGGAPEFLRISIALEVRDAAMMAMIEPRLPRVLDTFQVYLRELRRADLEGSAGVYRLKEELHRRINLAVYPAAVDNILFKEILVQ